MQRLSASPAMENLYWYFVNERQQMKARRDQGQKPPWTPNPILERHRFCNVYRIDDRVSQHLVRHALYDEEWSRENLIFRAVLFRMFNLPATWDFWPRVLGAQPTLANFNADLYADILTEWWRAGHNIFNGAYLVAGLHVYSDREKHRNWLYLLRTMLDDNMPAKMLQAPTYEAAFRVLRKYEMVGNFVGMQWLTDINYSDAIDFDENEFVIAGPGAERGLKKLGLPPDESGIRYLHAKFASAMAERKYDFPYLGGSRHPSLLDIQNTLCEFDKYCRGALPELSVGPAKIKQKFSPAVAQAHTPVQYMYPPKWRVGGSR